MFIERNIKSNSNNKKGCGKVLDRWLKLIFVSYNEMPRNNIMGKSENRTDYGVNIRRLKEIGIQFVAVLKHRKMMSVVLIQMLPLFYNYCYNY